MKDFVLQSKHSMIKKKLKVMVLMGGPSSEYEVSLATAQNIISALDPKKYLVRPALIDKAGRWFLAPSFQTPLIFSRGVSKSRGLIPMVSKDALSQSSNRPDVVFIAMHGTYGEDGRVQAVLDFMGIPYTGSGVLASALGMDKPHASLVFKEAGLLVPDFEVIGVQDLKSHKLIAKIIKRFSFPLVVKPANHGSSVGVSVVQKEQYLTAAIKEAFKYFNKVILQKFIKGREMTCGVLEDKGGKIISLPPTEIIPKVGTFYDYHSKYAEGGSEHITPPKNLSKKLIKKIQEASVLAHKVIGCSGMSRSDFILGEDEKLYILEINTIPGMTKTSLIPEAAKTAGINFPKFIDIIINAALRSRK